MRFYGGVENGYSVLPMFVKLKILNLIEVFN